jgi:uncharacterized protein YndB with AHSA1/START domain
MSAPVILTVTRDFAASAETVFDAWLDPALARQFLFATPNGTITTCEIDARVGGRFFIVDRRGEELPEHHGKFLEIDRPRRLVFLFRGPGTTEDEWTQVSLDIVQNASGCTLTLTHAIGAKWAAWKEQVRQGWAMILDREAEILEQDHG